VNKISKYIILLVAFSLNQICYGQAREINTQGDEKLDPATVTAIGVIASIGGSILEFTDDRKKAKKLDEMQRYLTDIRNDVKQLVKTNGEILDRVKKLPIQIDESIRKESLRIAYRELEDIRIVFMEWDQTNWDISSTSKLIGAYRDVVTLDNGTPQILNMVEWGEFISIVSKGKLNKRLIELMEIKYVAFNDFIQFNEETLAGYKAALKAKLNNKNYVNSYDLSEDYYSLTLSMNGDRNTTAYRECNCRRVFVGPCHDDYARRCDRCAYPVLDSAYTTNRNNFKSEINNLHAKAQKLMNLIAELKAINTHIVMPYIELLKGDKRFENIAEENTVLFLQEMEKDKDLPIQLIKKYSDNNGSNKHCDP